MSTGKSFANLDDIDAQLNGKPNSKTYQPLSEERPNDDGSIVGKLSEIMTDRTKAIEAGQQDEVSIIRDQAMSGVVQRLAVKVLSEQEVLGYAMAFNRGTAIPDHLPANEKTHIEHAALLLKASSQGLAIAEFRATPMAAVEGLRNVPALNPHLPAPNSLPALNPRK